ncbi:NADH-quinone oxidoreductase subunit C [Streptomyces orinoci]|uniref:NADH-quinone oxidoreductase subunit C n=1 Tax=Streptomyces orinoci TaxID=67339 RepID=A0ABV3K3U5_STRON|nr:NADH-quinone oxidoreductase subunit C [Streptomyces orinoci]
MNWLPAEVTELFGADATAEEAYGLLTVDVPATAWLQALGTARDRLGCTFFDWLSAVDEPGTGFRVCAHLVAAAPGEVRTLLVRTTVPHEAPVLPSAVGVYAGAAWHERETHEMFGVDFTGHPHLVPLLLPENFEGHPLRKDFVLAARVVKAWPGAKEPGESAAGAGQGGPRRRQMLPPGVPDPNEWGPLKGQLPAAPERPVRRARTAGEGTPPRRTRSVSEGSASQQAEGGAPAPRRMRSVSEGSASQQAEGGAPRRARSASEGSASQQPGGAAPRRARSASEGSATQRPDAPAPRPPRSTDAPWHHARPAFEEESPEGQAPPAQADADRGAEQPPPREPRAPRSEGAEAPSAPGDDGETPAGGESVPGDGRETPAGGEPVPPNDHDTPAGGEPA